MSHKGHYGKLRRATNGAEHTDWLKSAKGTLDGGFGSRAAPLAFPPKNWAATIPARVYYGDEPSEIDPSWDEVWPACSGAAALDRAVGEEGPGGVVVVPVRLRGRGGVSGGEAAAW